LEIKLKQKNTHSGLYTIQVGEHLIEVYCEMDINQGGYTFISHNELSVITNNALQKMITSRTDVLLKLRRLDSSQEYTVIKALDGKPLSVQLNSNTGYTSPENKKLLPYLFLGTQQAQNANNRNLQGFKSNNVPLTFRNCDSNPNAYFAFFSNLANKTPSSYHELNLVYERQGMAVNWRRTGLACLKRMPAEYFFLTEMHYGGCGTYTSSDRWSKSTSPATSASIGIR